MSLRDIDNRAVGLAILVGGAISFVHVSISTSVITVATSRTLVIAVGIVAVPAGVVVGLRSGSYDRQLIEGGVAAVCGATLGILGYAVVQAAMAEGMTLAYRVDIVFAVVLQNTYLFAVVFPALFLVGGYTASKTAEWTRQSLDEELTVGRFR
ncbi:MAG: hypothetical protein ABEI98_06650 [Halorhabdus sp.]